MSRVTRWRNFSVDQIEKEIASFLPLPRGDFIVAGHDNEGERGRENCDAWWEWGRRERGGGQTTGCDKEGGMGRSGERETGTAAVGFPCNMFTLWLILLAFIEETLLIRLNLVSYSSAAQSRVATDTWPTISFVYSSQTRLLWVEWRCCSPLLFLFNRWHYLWKQNYENILGEIVFPNPVSLKHLTRVLPLMTAKLSQMGKFILNSHTIQRDQMPLSNLFSASTSNAIY